jgi:anion-transporting  ArsA/GET3 family ATPase
VARVTFVTGKGGVGKSTIAAALATRSGRALLVRLGARRAEPVPGPAVSVLDVDGATALGEYLGQALPAALVRRVTESRLYRAFVAAAPGLRELMTVGKILHEARRYTGDAPTWSAVVVDTPATGHVVQLLAMPAAAAGAFGGLVRREAERLVAELADPACTRVLPVTVAEPLAVTETLELLEALRALRLPLGPLVVNRVHRAPAVVPATPPDASPALAAALRCAREESTWAAANRRELERLPAPRVELPFVHDTAELAVLAELLP